jgi:hypothetical protein
MLISLRNSKTGQIITTASMDSAPRVGSHMRIDGQAYIVASTPNLASGEPAATVDLRPRPKAGEKASAHERRQVLG